jgi:hypothetical protein
MLWLVTFCLSDVFYYKQASRQNKGIRIVLEGTILPISDTGASVSKDASFRRMVYNDSSHTDAWLLESEGVGGLK